MFLCLASVYSNTRSPASLSLARAWATFLHVLSGGILLPQYCPYSLALRDFASLTQLLCVGSRQELFVTA